ncbi:hypothetical protein SKAU_G00060720 [Synaphobranchus kaupii]|uniref:BHLH domain-containing protein n=1 Tax=Synaphobranchus kaupii TaxID=118154 RepID=A0A9Q1G5V5_SYNKA|nr:hypothetical protein SKAU_G00060720 [Synaphobranchus kaupii]
MVTLQPMLLVKSMTETIRRHIGIERGGAQRPAQWTSAHIRMPEITEKQTPVHKPQRKKNKESHNAVERHRKKKINAGINRIGDLLPCSPALKQSKNMILDQALHYIIQLKQQNDTLLLNGGDRVQAEEICRLRRQLEELRKESCHYMELLKANDISFLGDPTVHWKGKLRCAKLAKVMPTHLVHDGIIVYSNGNVVCPAAEDQSTPSPTLDVRKQPVEALVIQSRCDIMAGVGPKLCPNGSMLEDSPASSTSQVLLEPSLAPPVCMSSVRLVEQQPAKAKPVTKLASSLSYIALQGPCPLSANSSTMQPVVSTPTPTRSLTAINGQHAPISLPLPLSLTQAATASTPNPPSSVSRSVRYMPSTSVPSRNGAPPAFQISTAGSTQTTWTTLQLGGNSQPVCHPAPTPTPSPAPISSSTVSYSGLQGASVCSPVAKSSVQPAFAPPQVQAQPLAPPIPLPQAPTPPQSQSAFLPLLQVLQVRSTSAPVAPKTSNNPNMFILQPVNPSQPVAVARNSLPNQNPCQHIVIIQAANQNPAHPTSQGNTGPATVSTTDQTSTYSVVASGGSGVQTVGGKQLVHILPRPLTSTQTSQTVTVSGQVFSLQAMMPPGAASAQTTLQIIQPTTKEDPNINITLHSLGALASLNQSISHVPTESQALAPVAAQCALPMTMETVDCGSSAGLDRSAPLASAPMGGTTTVLLRNACIPHRTKRTGTKKASTAQRTISKQYLQLNTKPAGKQPPAIAINTREISMSSTAEPAAASELSHLAPRAIEPSHTATDITTNSSVTGPTVSSVCSTVIWPTIGSVSSTGNSVSSIATSATSKMTGPTATIDTSTVTGPIATSVTSAVIGPTATTSVSSIATIATSKMNGPTATVDTSTITAPTTTSISSTMAGSTISSVSTIVSSVSSTGVGPRVSSSCTTATIVSSTKTTPTATSVSFTVTGASGVSSTANSVSSTGHRITASPQVVFVTTASSRPADLQDSLSVSLPLIPTPSTSVSASPSMTTPLSHMSECRRPPSHQHDPALSTTASHSTLMEAKTSKLSMERGLGGADMEGHTLPRKDPSSLQQVCVLDQDALGHPLGSSSCGGSRGFSIASMLPIGHAASNSSSALGTFTFTSEQAEILAMAARAFFDQDGPGTSRGSGCSSDTPASAGWDVPKPPQSNHRKGSQAKPTDTLTGANLLVSLRDQPVVGTTSGPGVSRNSLSLSYTSSPHSQSQPSHSQPTQSQPTQSQTQPTQSQSTQLQSTAVGSLSVNNLIRPLSSGQQSYACSPSHAQQGSVSSPIATAVPVVQSPAPLLPPCPEYTPLKSAVMRPHGTDHHLKDMSKRPAPEDTLLPSGKRPKTCSAANMGRMDMKAAPPDHTQMMVSSSSGSSSISGGRGYPSDGLSGLFPGNSFMSSVLRPVEGHCVPQGPSHEQSHPQHIPHPPGHHLPMGNPYLKQQQQQQQQGQRHHLYQLQHHLTQPEPAQFHSIHQRTLQQDQHSQKKRGLVQGGQAGAPMGLPQKTHHVDKSREQQQQQQQQHQQQSSHSRHQHIHHIQQQQFGARPQEKSCEAQPVAPRAVHGSHMGQERQAGQNHSGLQRLMSSRTLEQLTSQPGGTVSHPSDITCTPSRQERHRISSYSAEALIGKSTSSVDQRMGLPLQAAHAPQDQADLHTYLDASRGKGSVGHNPQGHSGPLNVSCGSVGQHQLGGFQVQVSHGSEMTHKPTPPSQRGLQAQGIRMGLGSGVERQLRGVFPGAQGPMGSGQREQESCHQSFMQSLLAPHLSEQVGHQCVAQCCPPVSMEYSCGSGGSDTDLQAKAGSPSIPPTQKTPNMHISEGNKGHLNPQVSSNMQGPGVRGGLLPHPTTPQISSEPGRAPARSVNSVSQRARQTAQDVQGVKMRPGDRSRSGTLRSGNPFEPDGHLSLPASGGMLLGRQQAGGEAKRGSIVRFMADGTQMGGDNLVSDQHLAQNFGFSFIPEGGMNPSPINASPSFIPPVTQPSTSRTPAILPVEPQNTLPPFYTSYSPAAHPSLPNDIPLQYFSNQMFTSPSADKSSSTPLNNRFGSILSPPRPVGFTQASFPLLPDMPTMPIANSSSITPHLSNFNLTSLFPEITTAMPTDGTAMPMSPLLSLTNTSSADSGKQSNRPAHNISHILGHDGSSAV